MSAVIYDAPHHSMALETGASGGWKIGLNFKNAGSAIAWNGSCFGRIEARFDALKKVQFFPFGRSKLVERVWSHLLFGHVV